MPSKEFIFLNLTIVISEMKAFHSNHCFFWTWTHIRITGSRPRPADSDSVGLWSDPGVSIFRKMPGDLSDWPRCTPVALGLSLKGASFPRKCAQVGPSQGPFPIWLSRSLDFSECPQGLSGRTWVSFLPPGGGGIFNEWKAASSSSKGRLALL